MSRSTLTRYRHRESWMKDSRSQIERALVCVLDSPDVFQGSVSAPFRTLSSVRSEVETQGRAVRLCASGRRG